MILQEFFSTEFDYFLLGAWFCPDFLNPSQSQVILLLKLFSLESVHS
jgi:hypothetical protein